MRAAVLALEHTAARAGCAMGCPFSSSDELEAAEIKSKLEAGAYGPKHRKRYILFAGAAAGALAMILWII